jgi:hypothetical protein
VRWGGRPAAPRAAINGVWPSTAVVVRRGGESAEASHVGEGGCAGTVASVHAEHGRESSSARGRWCRRRRAARPRVGEGARVHARCGEARASGWGASGGRHGVAHGHA